MGTAPSSAPRELLPGETLVRRTVTTDYEGTVSRLPWLLAVVLVPLLLAALGQVWPRPSIERDLTTRAAAALTAAGFPDATVTFDGRDATVTGAPAGQGQRALAVVRGVDGVRVARTGGGPRRGADTMDITLAGNQVVLRGKVPDEDTRRAVLAAVSARAGGRQVVDQLTVAPGSELPGDVARFGELVRALGAGDGDRSIAWGTGGVTLAGPVASAGAKQDAEAAVRAALGADVSVDNQLTVAATTSPLTLHLQHGLLELSGEVPDDADRQRLLAAVSAGAGGRQVVDRLTVRAGGGPPADVAALRALARALTADGAGSGDLMVVVDGDEVTLSGSAPSAAARTTVEQAVRSALPLATVDSRLTVSAPPAADRAAVRDALNGVLAGAAITFEPDSARLTPQGADSVDRVAEILRGAPGVPVEIGGHVAVGPGGAENAQRLSDERAATVRAALIAAGIPAESLTARGYGDTRTKPDPAASRRVEITVL